MEQKFKALGHEVRLTIYRALRHEKLCVCEITELLEMSQSAVSQHLSQLRDAGLIESERHDQWIFYYPSENEFQTTIDDLFEESSDELPQTIQKIKEKNLCELRDSEGNLSERER
jgi:DNA-binding transcriptional ArsR family regulator